MGWADLLIDLEIPYDSEDALRLGTELMASINEMGARRVVPPSGGAGAVPELAEEHLQGRPPAAAMRRRRRSRRRARSRSSPAARRASSRCLRSSSTAKARWTASSSLEVNDRFDRDRQARGLLDRGPGPQVQAHGTVRGLDERAREVAAGVRHGTRHRARLARAHAGCVPAAHRQRRLQDDQPAPRRRARRRRARVHAGLRARLQRHHRVPRRLEGGRAARGQRRGAGGRGGPPRAGPCSSARRPWRA